MSVPVCVARSITAYTGSFVRLICSGRQPDNVTKQIGVRRLLPSHADSSCGGEKVVEKCFVGSQLSDSHHVRLDKWLTQLLHPELSRFEAGILMIGKIKPTVAIRTELRLIFSESESIECAVIFLTPDPNGYEKLITWSVNIQDFCSNRCHFGSVLLCLRPRLDSRRCFVRASPY